MRMRSSMFRAGGWAALVMSISVFAPDLRGIGDAIRGVAGDTGRNAAILTLRSLSLRNAHADDSAQETMNLEATPCGAPVSGRSVPLAGDCLYILRAATRLSVCEPACACAPKGTLPTTASDALLCLKGATGQGVELTCPCEASSSTTTTSTSSTSTTSTTLSLVTIGREIYDSVCTVCHRAGSYDTDGFAPDLAGKGDDVIQGLGSIDPQMSSIFLSQDEVTAMRAFLNSL